MKTFVQLLKEASDMWSSEVDTEWTPPEDLFTKDSEIIANTLKKSSESLKQAMARLNFYINRAGDNLSSDDKKRLEKAKDLLSGMFTEACKKKVK
jgi:hypothetical protein